jgi:hypothetical protein
MAVTKPIINAAYNPTKGGKPASIANDKDSGIMVIATVSQNFRSVIDFCVKSNKLKYCFILFYKELMSLW